MLLTLIILVRINTYIFFFSGFCFVFLTHHQVFIFYHCTDFFNMVTFKPIFDRNNVYSYVIVVHYPVEYELSHEHNIQERDREHCDKVMSVFPNTMWS